MSADIRDRIKLRFNRETGDLDAYLDTDTHPVRSYPRDQGAQALIELEQLLLDRVLRGSSAAHPQREAA